MFAGLVSTEGKWCQTLSGQDLSQIHIPLPANAFQDMFQESLSLQAVLTDFLRNTVNALLKNKLLQSLKDLSLQPCFLTLSQPLSGAKTVWELLIILGKLRKKLLFGKTPQKIRKIDFSAKVNTASRVSSHCRSFSTVSKWTFQLNIRFLVCSRYFKPYWTVLFKAGTQYGSVCAVIYFVWFCLMHISLFLCHSSQVSLIIARTSGGRQCSCWCSDDDDNSSESNYTSKVVTWLLSPECKSSE